MSDIAVSKADVLRAIETERAWWRAAIDLAAQASPLTGNEPVNGFWTFQELLGHINGWRLWTAARLEAAANESELPPPPWPAGMDEETEAGTDEINAWLQARSRSQSIETTIDETFALLDRIQVAVGRIPEEQLLTPGWFSDTDPPLASYPIGPALVGFSISHAHDEHAPALIAWLSERIGQHAELPPAPSRLGYED